MQGVRREASLLCQFAFCIFRLPLTLDAVLLAFVGSGGAGGFLRVTAIRGWAESIRGMCVRNVDRLRSMYMASVGPISPIARPDLVCRQHTMQTTSDPGVEGLPQGEQPQGPTNRHAEARRR
jgi:hypothetical protein